jgi:hypothetical protein
MTAKEPCEWNIGYSAKPDMETQTVLCKCDECGKFLDLPCHRDFETGALVVQVLTCKARGGYWTPRNKP